MKRILTSCAITLAGFAILAMPTSADACSRCDTTRPRCLEALNSRCSTYLYEKTVTICEEYYTSCAYVYAPAGISADGSIANLAASVGAESAAEQVRGCHGLIVDRTYSESRQAQARADTRQILL